MNYSVCLLLGSACGWIAAMSMPRSSQRWIMYSILTGGFGAAVGVLLSGYLFGETWVFDDMAQQGISLASLGVSATGAAICLSALGLFRRPATFG